MMSAKRRCGLIKCQFYHRPISGASTRLNEGGSDKDGGDNRSGVNGRTTDGHRFAMIFIIIYCSVMNERY